MEASIASRDSAVYFDKLSSELRVLIYANLRAEDSILYLHARPVLGSDPSSAMPFTAHVGPSPGLCGVNKEYRSEYLDHVVGNFLKQQETVTVEAQVVDLDFTHIAALLAHATIQHQVRIKLTFTKHFVRTALDLVPLSIFLDNKTQLPLFAANAFTWGICQVGDCTKTLDPVDGVKDVLALNTALNDIDWADRLQLPPDLDALINATFAFNKPLYVQNDPVSYEIVDELDDPSSISWTFRHVENKHQPCESGPALETMTPGMRKYLQEWHEVLMENCEGHGLPGTAPLPFPAFPSNINGVPAARYGGAGCGTRSGSEDQDVHVSEWDLQRSADRMEQELQEHGVEVKTDEDEGKSIKVEDESTSTQAEHGE
ncbi:hypothetical protein B0A48_15408 [Cryoendolithus antarcticus]|uniref:Uncharacterized protein n=1 Tax=Cryoendolithus antarcticus TaxID=1507870 RepID=A0A1V8SHX6_9PEZI|nr:hypothetical protein B0A48_15408 [Cryoendolithus antarcticus]